MSIRGQSILAVVPARGGSKSIPRKNLQLVAGKTLIGHVATVVKSLDWIDHAVLSTDDEEIATEGRSVGLSVPFMRPDPLASDTANSIDMWRHAWLESESAFGTTFDISVLLEPTSPLRRAADIAQTVEAMLECNSSAAATVSITPAHYTPHKTLTVSDGGCIGYYLPTGASHSLRQTIPRYYHRNGICYAVRRPTLLEQKQILTTDCQAVIIERPVVNIDEPFDLKFAEFLISAEQKN